MDDESRKCFDDVLRLLSETLGIAARAQAENAATKVVLGHLLGRLSANDQNPQVYLDQILLIAGAVPDTLQGEDKDAAFKAIALIRQSAEIAIAAVLRSRAERGLT